MLYPTVPDHATPTGRGPELDQLQSLLDRPNPAHVSIIGPKGMGKTLLLRALLDQAKQWDRFAAVGLWDLRRHTPASDAAFFEGLAHALADALPDHHATLADYLREEPALEMVQDVYGELVKAGDRVLLVVDHLDRALRQPDITKGLWDNLRSLAIGGALTLVTATPKRLRELTDADSRTSEFWNVFAPPVELGPFSSEGLSEFLGPLEATKGTLSTPTRKEFERQTGSVPLLAALLAGRLLQADAAVEKADVSNAADALARSSDYVASLWADTPAPAQGLLVELATQDDSGLPKKGVPRDRLADLLSRGYVTTTSAGNVAPAARMVLTHAGLHQVDAGDLARLFGPDADAKSNQQALLELQLEAVQGGPDAVRIDAQRAIRNLTLTPKGSLEAVRSLAHAALDAIWDAHYPDRLLPRETVDAWHRHGSDWARRQAKPLIIDYKLPAGRHARASHEKILGLLTDPAEFGEVRVTEGTHRLIIMTREAGNYGHHVGDAGHEEVSFEMAAAVCALGVELVRRLASELHSGGGQEPFGTPAHSTPG